MLFLLKKQLLLKFVNNGIYGQNVNKFARSFFISSLHLYTFNSSSDTDFIQLTAHLSALGVHQNASKLEIREAYLQKCKEYHPDLHPGNYEMHEKFIKINKAYEVLTYKMNKKCNKNISESPKYYSAQNKQNHGGHQGLYNSKAFILYFNTFTVLVVICVILYQNIQCSLLSTKETYVNADLNKKCD